MRIGIGIRIGNSITGSVLDPATSAFITAAGITDPTQINAVNRLVLNYKGQGNLNSSVDLWTGTNAIYPIVGGSATSHMYNLKDPRDLDAAFRLAFSGGWTHNSNGILGNGTNSFADTFISQNLITNNSHRVNLYFRENTKRVECQFGYVNRTTFDSTQIGFGWNTNDKVLIGSKSSQNFSTNSVTNINGLVGFNRTLSTSFKIFRNGNVFETITATSNTDNNTNTLVLGGERWSSDNSVRSISNKTFCFLEVSINQGISDANSLLLYQIIQQYQADLNRQV
jgi:hypothetical protein